MDQDKLIKFAKENFVGEVKGKLLDFYDVIKQLGKGGYGKVYEVKNKKTGELRACKHLSKLNIKNLDKFRREIEILKKMDHPNIIRIYEVYESERSLYIVMEECKGGEIFDRIIEHIQNKQMYSEKDAAIIFQQVMSCIQYCHNQNICHRDLKPENILYLNSGSEKNNRIKIIDFGLSQASDRLKTKVGTAYYVSPEILKGNYTQLCDIWSAGVILYILLSGDPPFNGANDSAIYNKIAEMRYTFPESKWKNVSNDAKDLICHMLVPEKERFNAEQVLSHKWFQNANEAPLSEIEFNAHNLFMNFVNGSMIKKMGLMFIATRLDENEINNLKKVFSAFDTGKDGQISYEEFKQGLMGLKSNKIKEEDVKSLFDKIDVDKNGKIDYTEFIAATIDEANYNKKERLLEAFDSFDKDGSGQISKGELLETLNAAKCQEKEIEKFIKAVDQDGNGKISREEFMKLMEKKE
jgi:calcium-dependent protein kinase